MSRGEKREKRRQPDGREQAAVTGVSARRRVGRVLLRLGIVACLVAAGTGVYLVRQPSSDATTVAVYFRSTVGLYPGSDVRMLGVPVGVVTAVEPEGTQVKVSLRIDPEFAAAADTGAVILAPSLVSDRFVQLSEPWESGPRLESGDEIGVDKTAVPVELDQLYESLDDIAVALGPDGANKDGALSDLLTTGADNLDGVGADLNRAVRDFSKMTSTLSGNDKDLFATVDNLKRFNDMLVANDTQVGDVNRQFATVAAFLADDRDDLAAAMKSLAGALGRVQGFIRDNRGALRSSVKKLTGTSQVLARQRDSLDEMLRTAPVALQNFLRAFDRGNQRLRGRVDLNEVSIWAQANGTATDQADPTDPTDPSGPSASPTSAASGGGSSDSAPPLLLPGLEDTP
ncbi:MCE family protein [Nocardioides plantarum]|uniref:MCE family protein n=1 Tax=Nocardioides plantarum TaxID=29299 RepID=A0ABV5KCP3_9ACTN|nr:MCE family protein [Nocardioides plantarum]